MASKRDAEFGEKFQLRIKAKVTPCTSHYVDDDGQDIWKIVATYFGWDGYTKLEEKQDVAIAS